MNSNLSTQPKANMKKNLIIYGCIALFFCIALFNVYSFFQAKRQEVLEEQARVTALIEAEKQARAEAERQAQLKHKQKLLEQELAQEKAEAELLAQKVAKQERLEQYRFLKEARKSAKEQKNLDRLIESAREHKYVPEGLSGKIRRTVESATYLTIKNNPEDYKGTFKPQGILRGDKLTSGGANSLMLFSILSDDLKAIQEIINIGHDVNSKNKTGHTPLMFAGAYNSPEVVSFLIKQGADLKATEYSSQGNSLHVSARFNPKPETVELLIQQGLDIEAKDKDGNTALLLATKHNQNLQVVEKLIELGADVNVLDDSGKDSYGYAYERLNKRTHIGKYRFISREYQQSVLEKLRP